MLKSNPSYLGIAGKNPALGPPKSALGLRPWADFGGPWAGFFPEFLSQGLDFLPQAILPTSAVSTQNSSPAAELSVWWSVQGKLYTQFTSRRLFQGCVKSGKKLHSRYNLHARKHNHLPHIQTAWVESFRCSLYCISISIFSSPFFSQFGPTDIDWLKWVMYSIANQRAKTKKRLMCMTAHEKIGYCRDDLRSK